MEHNVQYYDSNTLEQRCKISSRPYLPIDHRTIVTGLATVSGKQHIYESTFHVSINPSAYPPHTHFECEQVRFGFYCEPIVLELRLLTETLRAKIKKLLAVDFPQVTCELGEILRFV